MANIDEWGQRQAMVEVGKRMYRAGMAWGSDGNLSVRLSEDRILITPSRVAKGFMEPQDIIIIDTEGRKCSGELSPSLETVVHLAAYEERTDACAVVHAHPPICIAFTVAGMALPACVLPEIEVLFGGEIPIAAYATPAAVELANSIRKPIREKDVVLLAHHGAVSVGGNILQAWMRMEHVEAAASIIYYARQLGNVQKLPEGSLEGLRRIRERITKSQRETVCGSCRACEPGAALREAQVPCPDDHDGESDEELGELVRSVVRDVIENRYN